MHFMATLLIWKHCSFDGRLHFLIPLKLTDGYTTASTTYDILQNCFEREYDLSSASYRCWFETVGQASCDRSQSAHIYSSLW